MQSWAELRVDLKAVSTADSRVGWSAACLVSLMVGYWVGHWVVPRVGSRAVK